MSDIETKPDEMPEKIEGNGVTPEERYQLIAAAAYRRAEQRDFAPGRELDDWLEAEAEVDQKLAESQPAAETDA